MVERRKRLARVVSHVVERKREKLAKLAQMAGYSYKHFRYAILPEILALSDCLSYDKENDELVYICEDMLTPGERAVLEARPVEG